MITLLGVSLVLVFIAGCGVAIVQYRKLRETRRRQSRSLCLALKTLRVYGEKNSRHRSATMARRVAERQGGHRCMPIIAVSTAIPD